VLDRPWIITTAFTASATAAYLVIRARTRAVRDLAAGAGSEARSEAGSGA
jgi:hypothetical protein